MSERKYKHVPESHPLMQEARKARQECAGDTLFPVGIVLVKDGFVVARAGNGFNKGPHLHICPRYVANCPSGEGYDLCSLHNPEGHAEPMLMKVAKESGIDPTGCDVFMYGHWWACEPCWETLIENGVRDVFLAKDAETRFSREQVYKATLQPSVKTVYIAGALTNVNGEKGDTVRSLYEKLGQACESIGCEAYVPHLHSDPEKNPNMSPQEVFDIGYQKAAESDLTVAEVSNPSLGTGGEIAIAHQNSKHVVLVSKKGHPVSRFVRGNPAVVYHVEYEDEDEVCEKLIRIIQQL